MEKDKLNVLLFDLETAPNLGYTWGKWETDVISFKENWYVLSVAYKWLNESEVHCLALPDYKLYEKQPINDEFLVRDLWELFNKADLIIAHNGDSFDIKKANARFITHKLKPPTNYKTLDTRKVARKYFKFDSNRLDDLGVYLKVGRKMKTGGFDLWLQCMQGGKQAWSTMKEYNKQDVVLLEKIYLAMKPWVKKHPFEIIGEVRDNCPKCSSSNNQSRGHYLYKGKKHRKLSCNDCGHHYRNSRVMKNK